MGTNLILGVSTGKRIKGPEYIWGRGHRGRTLGLVGQVGCGQRGRSHYGQLDTRAVSIRAVLNFEFCDQMNLPDEPHQVYG